MERSPRSTQRPFSQSMNYPVKKMAALDRVEKSPDTKKMLL